MKRLLEGIKKGAAGFIVILLALLMGVTFSSQPVDEILDVITGSSSIGRFDGESISPRIYGQVDNHCRDQYREFGEIPDFLLQNCIEQGLQQMYVMPAVARRLGVNQSTSYTETQILEFVQQEFQRQQTEALPDDRVSMRELYRLEMQRNPIDLRVRSASTENLFRLFREPFMASTNMAQAISDTAYITANMRIIKFNDADLLRAFGPTVTVTEEEILEEYENELSELPEEDQLSFERRREALEDRVRNRKRQAAVVEAKRSLSSLEEASLEEVQGITRIAPVNVGLVSMDSLPSLQIPGGSRVDASAPEVLEAFISAADGQTTLAGPIQQAAGLQDSGSAASDATIFIEISGVQVSRAPAARPDGQTDENQMVSGLYLQHIIEKEAERGNFRLQVSPAAPR